MNISRWLIATALLPLSLTAACGNGDSAHKSAGGLTKVKVAPDWIAPDVTWMSYTIGITNGFYKAAGLDVSLVPPPDNSSSVKLVASGQADIGETTLPDQMFAAKEGLPVISIANLSQSNNWGFFTPTGKKITGASLKGMRVGVFDDAWTKAMMGVVLKKAGLTSKDVKPVTATDSDVPLLLAKKIDVATNTTNFAPQEYAQQTGGKQPEVLLATAAGAPDIPIWNYAGNKRWLQKNPDVARKWLAATAKAADWASAHPEDAVKAYETYHKLKPAGYATDLAEWKATIPLLKASKGMFTASDAQWTQLGQALKDAGQLDKVLAPSEYYTNAYVGQ